MTSHPSISIADSRNSDNILSVHQTGRRISTTPRGDAESAAAGDPDDPASARGEEAAHPSHAEGIGNKGQEVYSAEIVQLHGVVTGRESKLCLLTHVTV